MSHLAPSRFPFPVGREKSPAAKELVLPCLLQLLSTQTVAADEAGKSIHLWESKSHACWWNSHVWVKKKAWPLVESLHAPFCCKNPSGFFAVSLFVLVESLYFALFPSLLLLVICQKVWWLVWSMFVLLTSSLCLLAGYSCWLIVSNMFSHHLWLIFDKTLTNGETK